MSEQPAAKISVVRRRTPRTSIVKTTMNLPASTADALKELADARNSTLTDALSRSVILHQYLDGALRSGGKILIEEPGKPVKELVIL